MSGLRALRERNQVAKLILEMNKKMDAFVEAVEEFKLLKEEVPALNEELGAKKAEHAKRLEAFEKELHENRARILHEEAAKAGKTLISTEDLEELKAELGKRKDGMQRLKAQTHAEIKVQVQEEVEKKAEIERLMHEKDKAELVAENANLKKEIENLKEASKRLSDELESQKKLTANIAQSTRPAYASTRQRDD